MEQQRFLILYKRNGKRNWKGYEYADGPQAAERVLAQCQRKGFVTDMMECGVFPDAEECVAMLRASRQVAEGMALLRASKL